MKRKKSLTLLNIFSEMNMNPFTLSFKGEIEKEFLDDYFSSNLILLRITFLLGIFYYAAFALLDAAVLPQIKSQLFTIRFLFVCPIITIVFLLSFLKSFRKWWQIAVSISIYAAGLGIIYMTILAKSSDNLSYYNGLILILIYCYLLIKLRFTLATFLGWSLVLTYSIAMKLFTNMEHDVFITNNFFLISANILGLFGNYYLEYYTRKGFYFRQLLNKERQKVISINQELELKVADRTKELEEEIIVRKKAEKQIEKDLQEKILLLQEIYHRTKNNMQVISAMLSMRSLKSENEYVKTTFKEIINKIKAMSLVHQKLYQAKDLSRISLKEYIEDLLKLLMQSYDALSRKIVIKFDLQDVNILIDTAIPLGLILNELISNTFKHAFPDDREGEIFIQLFEEKDHTLNLILSDNGVGLPQDFDVRRDGSMGLVSVFSLVERQLKGEITIDTKDGLKWHIKLKDNLHIERI